MTERSRTPAPITIDATRVGRTDLGPSSVTVDDDTLTIVIRSGESPTQIALAVIDELSLADSRLELRLRDGTRVVLSSPASADLRNDIVTRCRTLPELTRTLRAFGSRRRQRGPKSTAASDQQRFFAPLIDARRNALAANAPEATIDAFDARRLDAAVSAALRALASDRFAEPGPERRALEAELIDLSEPLSEALAALGEAAAQATDHIDDLRHWRVWAAQLRMTFEVADRVWLTLDASLDHVPGGA
jgi:hypothetical protein